MPDLDFAVTQATVLPYAATPSLLFKLSIANRSPESVRSIMLRVQVQIAAAQRHYNGTEQAQLVELFGTPDRWGTTVKPLLWTQTIVLVPAFEVQTVVDLPLPCTYDFEVVSAKYFHALEAGTVPLEFLFSGTIFYAGKLGLQAAQISWEKEATYAMPISLWQALMEHYFPNSAWLRVRRDLFDRLYAYKTQIGVNSWEATLERLLDLVEEPAARSNGG